MKTRTSTLIAASIAMMALISVNASAEGPDHGRRSNGNNNAPRVENNRGSKHSMPNDRVSPSIGNHNNGNRNNGGNYNVGSHNANHNNTGYNNRDNHNNHNDGYSMRPYNERRPEARPELRTAPRAVAHYSRPIPPRRFNRSAAYYRRATIFADRIAAAAANALVGAIVATIPPYYSEVLIDGILYYLADNTLYRPVVISGRPYFEIVSPYYY